MSFDTLESRVVIRGWLSAETGLHIGRGGSSYDPSATDSPIIRDAASRPFIPGSSLKGALRAYLESLLRGLDHPALSVCDPLADPCLPARSQKGRVGIEDLKEEARGPATDGDGFHQAIYDKELTRLILAHSCCMCRLFGSPWLASSVMIKDLFVDPDRWFGRVELRDGVGINRDTETARQGIKYDFEVVPPSTGFRLEMVVENAGDERLGVLAIGLRELGQGRVPLGGKTTRGLGGVRLELEEIEVVGGMAAGALAGGDRAALVSYLMTGQGKSLKGEALQDFLHRAIAVPAAKINGKE